MNYIILATALIPVVILILYIYFRDKNSPEPVGQLVKAFGMGILSVPLSLCLSIPLGILGAYPAESTTIVGGITTAFFAAAIPEEVAKFFVLWLLVRKNRHFDENMDGIVYAVFVSLGFAALENIMYLFSNTENFITVGVSRAIFAVPGHFCFGIIMGYYYSLYRFWPFHQRRNAALVLISPIMAHGIYDAILMVSDASPAISGILTVVFIIFCFWMWKYSAQRVRNHLQRDMF